MFSETEEIKPCQICDVDTEIVIITDENRDKLPMPTHLKFPDGIVPEAYAQKQLLKPQKVQKI